MHFQRDNYQQFSIIRQAAARQTVKHQQTFALSEHSQYYFFKEHL